MRVSVFLSKSSTSSKSNMKQISNFTYIQETVQELLQECDVKSGQRISDAEFESSVTSFLEILRRFHQIIRNVARSQIRDNVVRSQLKLIDCLAQVNFSGPKINVTKFW